MKITLNISFLTFLWSLAAFPELVFNEKDYNGYTGERKKLSVKYFRSKYIFTH